MQRRQRMLLVIGSLCAALAATTGCGDRLEQQRRLEAVGAYRAVLHGRGPDALQTVFLYEDGSFDVALLVIDLPGLEQQYDALLPDGRGTWGFVGEEIVLRYEREGGEPDEHHARYWNGSLYVKGKSERLDRVPSRPP